MSQNGMLARQREKQQYYFAMGQKIGFQKACDFIAIALNSPEVMGKSIMSGDKINKIMLYAIDICNEHSGAFDVKDPECDYLREKIDDRQKKIFKEKFVSFIERYPNIKEVTY